MIPMPGLPNTKLPLDFKGILGKLLRGNNVYGAGGTAPNPLGNNQYIAVPGTVRKRISPAAAQSKVGVGKSKLNAMQIQSAAKYRLMQRNK